MAWGRPNLLKTDGGTPYTYIAHQAQARTAVLSDRRKLHSLDLGSTSNSLPCAARHLSTSTSADGSVVLSADEFEWSEDDSKRGVDSDVHGERNNEGMVTLSSTVHFANGNKRVNKR